MAAPSTSTQSASGGSCDAISDGVHALVPGTSAHTDTTAVGIELCKWDSAQPTSAGMHALFQATLADRSFFDATSQGLDQSTSYTSDVKKFSPTGFDAATGFWNAPTHTFELLVKNGDHSTLLEGSTSLEPSVDALVTIAQMLVG